MISNRNRNSGKAEMGEIGKEFIGDKIRELLVGEDLSKLTLGSVFQQVSKNFSDRSFTKEDVYEHVLAFIDQEANAAFQAASIVPENTSSRSTRNGPTPSKSKTIKRKTITTKTYKLSEGLAAFMNESESSKSSVYKRIREYLKKKDLLTDDDEFECDATLEKLLNAPKSSLKTFKGLLASHFLQEISDSSEKPKKKKKTTSSGNSAFMKPMLLSESLSKVVEVEKASRPEVVRLLWKYILRNGLQDENDRRYIQCDDNLTELFKTSRVHMFTLNKHLSKHLYPIE